MFQMATKNECFSSRDKHHCVSDKIFDAASGFTNLNLNKKYECSVDFSVQSQKVSNENREITNQGKVAVFA